MRELRRRGRWVLSGVAAFAPSCCSRSAGNSLAHYRGWSVPRMEPAALSAEARAPTTGSPKPAGDGPFPTALLYSGCDGPKDNLERWAAMLNAHGWAAIIVDSHGPRGFSDYEVWRLICAGQMFMGSERAGDVLVSIDDARRMPFVDPDRLVLIGASHGGWAIMDLLALDPPRAAALQPRARCPTPRDGGPARRRRRDDPALSLLRHRPTAPRATAGAGRSRRCSCSARTTRSPTAGRLPRIADRARAPRGVPVETLCSRGVTHGFDQEERAALSTLVFDEAATEEALDRGAAFLDGLRTAR